MTNEQFDRDEAERVFFDHFHGNDVSQERDADYATFMENQGAEKTKQLEDQFRRSIESAL